MKQLILLFLLVAAASALSFTPSEITTTTWVGSKVLREVTLTNDASELNVTLLVSGSAEPFVKLDRTVVNFTTPGTEKILVTIEPAREGNFGGNLILLLKGGSTLIPINVTVFSEKSAGFDLSVVLAPEAKESLPFRVVLTNNGLPEGATVNLTYLIYSGSTVVKRFYKTTEVKTTASFLESMATAGPGMYNLTVVAQFGPVVRTGGGEFVVKPTGVTFPSWVFAILILPLAYVTYSIYTSRRKR